MVKGVYKGVCVRTIQADTTAAKSDLRPADVITEVDGVSVTSARELQYEILKKKVGDQVNLGVWRSGKKITLSVKTAELPAETTQASTPPAAPPPPQTSNTSFGVEVQDLTPELTQESALKS